MEIYVNNSIFYAIVKAWPLLIDCLLESLPICFLASTMSPRPLFSFTRFCKWHWDSRLGQVYINILINIYEVYIYVCVYIHIYVIYITCMTFPWDMVIRFISLMYVPSRELSLSQSFRITLKKNGFTSWNLKFFCVFKLCTLFCLFSISLNQHLNYCERKTKGGSRILTGINLREVGKVQRSQGIT